MDAFSGHIDTTALGLDHGPLVKSGRFDVASPSLKDNTGLADRLSRVAAKTWDLEHVSVPLSLTSGLDALFSDSDVPVWAALSICGNKGRLAAFDTEGGPTATYGLAVDVGSTTLVLALVDLDKPSVMDQLTLANPQVEYGSDILTRAHFAEKGDGLQVLVDALRRGVNQGLHELCRRNGIRPGHVVASSLAGNTSMTHFLLGRPVRTLIRQPYVPVINRPEGLFAKDIDLEIAPEAPVLVLPNKGSYFGGDLMAGLVTAGFSRAEKPCMLVDVGTNAEVVLGQSDWMVGAAGAAGPALEGGVAEMGMVAGPGAVDRVRIDRKTGDVSWRTIGDVPPKGICGSGLIDLYAEMFLSGVIDFRGKLTLPEDHPRRLMTDEGPAFVIAHTQETENGRPLTLSEVELDILTRSKAGMYTILSTVMLSVGLDFSEIDKFFVAGTFGQYIDPQMAVAVGMIPDIPLERFVPLGNSSLKGTILTLISDQARQEVDDVWQRLTYLEMNVNQDLMNRFSAARFIPHTDRALFPSVGTTIL